MQNRKNPLRNFGLGLLATSLVVGCQKPPHSISGEHVSLKEAIKQSQVDCFTSIKEKMLQGTVISDPPDFQRMDVDFSKVLTQIQNTKFSSTVLGAEVSLKTKKASALRVAKDSGQSQLVAELTPASQETADLFMLESQFDDYQVNSHVSYRQYFSVDASCTVRLNHSEVVQRTIENSKLTVISKDAYPGTQAGTVKSASQVVSVPAGAQDAEALEYYNSEHNLTTWIKNNPTTALVLSEPGMVLDGKVEILPDEGRFNANLNRNSKFEHAVLHLFNSGVEAVTAHLYTSQEDNFAVLSNSPGKENWYNLSKQKWDSLTIGNEVEFQNTFEADPALFKKLGLSRIQMSTNTDFSYDNLAAYWKVTADLKASSPWTLAKEMISVASVAPEKSDALVTDQTQLSTNIYLKASKLVQVDNPEVQKLIEQLKPFAKETRWQMALRVVALVNKLVVYDYNSLANSTIYPLSTTEVLSRKTGVCQHFANLFAALARGVGLPARIVTGYLLHVGGVGMHAWNEIEVADGIWMPIEPQRTTLLISSGQYLPLNHGTFLEDETLSGSDVKVYQMRFDLKLLEKIEPTR